MHYGASKAAIIHMTKTLALEWAPFNIHVNCIAPGWFLTEMTKDQQEGENRDSSSRESLSDGSGNRRKW